MLARTCRPVVFTSQRRMFSWLFPKNESLSIGDKAPVFKAKNQDGVEIDFSTIIGHKKAVVFFYPKDFTPVCTKEVCSFRDNYKSFEDGNVALFGVSADPSDSHSKFKAKHKLPFDLLADESREIRRLFGVKSALMGIVDGRVTFAIDQEGRVIDIFNSTMGSTDHVEAAKNAFKL